MITKEIKLPDLGTTGQVEIIEITVKPGDRIKKEETLITLESEKASMEVPSPYDGVIQKIMVKVGDKVSTHDLIAIMEVEEANEPKLAAAAPKVSSPSAEPVAPSPTKVAAEAPVVVDIVSHSDVHAGPGVRRLARELGADLGRMKGTGRKDRILKEDVHLYVKNILIRTQQGTATSSALPSAPVVDFEKFGAIEVKPLTRIKKFTAVNLSRNWLLIPHVTQFDEADITELENFRKAEQAAAMEQGVKLTLLAFLMKAAVMTLKTFPTFNASLDAKGENLILKKYFHIGVAVETPDGLVVPVVRDVDKKSILALAKELGDISHKARAQGLTPAEMQGSCFTLSSLGGIGGTAFTPIVNMPDVAILGISKAAMKPVYRDGQFVPRLLLPLSLSYDHRVIDGAEGARFIVQFAKNLESIRKLSDENSEN